MNKLSKTVKTLFPVLLLVFAGGMTAPALAEEPAGGKTVNVIVDIEDMTCSLCVTAINQALRRTEGVLKAKASLKTKQAEVIVPKNFPVQTLLDAVKKTGYTGRIAKIEDLSQENLGGS